MALPGITKGLAQFGASVSCWVPVVYVLLIIILQHTGLYPIVSKGMRLIAQGKDPLEGQRHMCGMGNMFHYHSTGFPELDELMRTPQPLIFVMELLQVSSRKTLWIAMEEHSVEQSAVFFQQLFSDFSFWADSKKRTSLLYK